MLELQRLALQVEQSCWLPTNPKALLGSLLQAL
jgi:hypothetical protein